MRVPRWGRSVSRIVLVLAGALSAGAAATMLGTCGPFTDVAADAFCPFVLEIFDLGITAGTTATTYDPTGDVTRVQMAAFLSRTVDGVLKRGNRRAAMNQFWTQKRPQLLWGVGIPSNAGLPASDGEDIWVPIEPPSNSVWRIHPGGSSAGIWTAATGATAAIDVLGHVFITGATTPGSLYRIISIALPSSVEVVASNLGGSPAGLAYDGAAIWTANTSGSVSVVTAGDTPPFSVSTVTAGFGSPVGALYDGGNVWVTDNFKPALLKLDASGAIVQTVTVGTDPLYPIYDGANIWVPNGEDNTVSVVRASNGVVLATLTGNGLSGGFAAAFDGRRILVTNLLGDSVSLWKAADLTPLGSVGLGTGSQPKFACSDGLKFWITLSNRLLPF